MDFKKDFADPDLSEDGVWHDYRGGRILLRRMKSKAFVARLNKLRKPFLRLIQKGRFPVEQDNELTRKAIAEAGILNWEGFEDGGKELPYTPETAIRMMETYPEFEDDVFDMMQTSEAYKNVETEETVKNSRKRSSGSSNTDTKETSSPAAG